MSLGFNQNRKHRMSTLPGAVNATTVRESPRRATTTAAAAVLYTSPTPAVASTGSRRRSPPAPTLGSKRPPTVSKVFAPPPEEATTASHNEVQKETPAETVVDDAHLVYASVAAAGLPSAEGDETVASVGERVVLVYPMRSEEDDGVVTMRKKCVHGVTGQLSYRWVRVYDPNTETRYVTNFSLLP